MTFVDSNIPMYLVGAEHPNKARARRLLERAVAEERPLATSVEVFQEILHRYVAIQRLEAIGPAFDLLETSVDRVLDIEKPDINKARELLMEVEGLSARDALHASVMARAGIQEILSLDAGFDQIDWIVRISD